ncbi:SDR family NAD(P)-dependent oxidoreductase [Nostoc sp. CHAB 5784]|uniref:type I polyketide synthase n=1 Tax=Nostoc mirabile TaxID=2907820 RepID=UPI001E5B86C7|nr:type I polyketide synthase [Nostoc mirabile]MCC5666482.1 SDR family NAD(P)-dependent oxidoreductase [Nostoc mirabile CHAB5784]
MEPIAIIGIGCRFPGAKDPEAFWELLRNGVDAITEIPTNRWDLSELYDPDPEIIGKMNSRCGGFLQQVDQFDPHFFGISPREAMSMDPQQRLLLEVAWEALEDAGQVREQLLGTRTGVFVGISSANDYSLIQGEDYSNRPNSYDLTGNALSVAAGRLSYLFNFRGPSMAVDTACSSSLVAVHLACQSLWNKESTLALAGGVNIIVSPTGNIGLTKLKALSPDGRCKTFDAQANGYVRSEGSGFVVLKPLSQALADNDQIYALIRGSAINHDGRSKGLTVPYGPAQEALIRQALENAGVTPDQISYVELHGTGTPLGDPIEAIALGTVLATDRPAGNYCAVGSVKSNIGHLEAASGIAGLIKVALSLKHQQIPQNLHFHQPNPYIPFDTLPIRVQQSLTPWPQGSNPAKASISSFGFSGTNAHVVLEQPPQSSLVKDDLLSQAGGEKKGYSQSAEISQQQAYLLPLSAHSLEAAKSLVQTYHNFLETQELNTVSLQNICYTASVRRTHHEHRLAFLADSSAELQERLQDFLQGKSDAHQSSGRNHRHRRPKIVFVFSGQGPQWWAMGRELLEQEPVFRATIEECDALIKLHTNWSLLAELTADASQSRLQETEIAQPAIFALQVALTHLWRFWGIEPKAVVGHSLGEVAAAHIAGVLSLADAVQLICDRGRLMQQATGNGKMAAVELSPKDTEYWLRGYEGQLAIAAINSPTSTVVSGEPAAIESFLELLQREQPTVYCKLLPVNYAFHSPQMLPFAEELVETLDQLQPQAAKIPIFSTVTGQSSNGADFDAAYWGRNLQQPVRFAPAIEELVSAGQTIFLEISPHPVLSGYISQCLSHLGQQGTVLSSLRRGQPERATLLSSLGNLYTLGFTVDWQQLYPSECQVVSLPSYPWQRERYWFERKPQAKLSTGKTNLHPLLGQRVRSALKETLFESELNINLQPYLVGHQVYDMVVLPGAAYLEIALAGAKAALGSGFNSLEQVLIQEALIIPEDASRIVQLILTPENAGQTSFYILSLADDATSWIQHATGKINAGQIDPVQTFVSWNELQASFDEQLSVEAYYQQLRDRGLQYGPSFQGIEQLWRREGEALGRIWLPEALVSEAEAYQLHPVLVDSGFQLLFATLGSAKEGDTYLPVGLDSLRVYRRPETQLWIHGQIRPKDSSNQETRTGDLRFFDDAGQIIVEIEGLQVKRAKLQALQHKTHEDLSDWLYEVKWQPRVSQSQYLPADYILSPLQVSARVQPDVAQLCIQHGLEIYDELFFQREILSGAYVVKAFQTMGWEFHPQQRLTTGEIAKQLGVVNRYHQLLGRLLEILQEEEILTQVGSKWQVCRVPEKAAPDERYRELLAQYSADEAELTLLAQCGQKLPEILRGECDPLQLLFPQGSYAPVEKLYQNSPGARVFNLLVQKAVSIALERLPEGRKIRILEIGAGTGGTTSYMLPQLPANQTEYVFTDVSYLFLSKAQEKFCDYPFLQYQLLDIEQDIETQGFDLHQFDVILAANVIHATSNVRHTLNHVQQLLAPEGILVLLEGTGRQRWLDLIFGLTEGWWKFADRDLRPVYPLLAPQQWQDVLAEIGFTQTTSIPQIEANDSTLSQQAVIIARAPGAKTETQQMQVISPALEPQSNWLIFADNKGIAQKLASQIKSRGEACVTVFAGEFYQQLGEGEYRVNPEQPEDFQQLLKQVVGNDQLPCRGIVHLWSLEAAAPEVMTASDLEAASVLVCRSVLHLVQALAKAEFSELPSLWLVTQGAQAVGSEASPLAVAQTPLWGLGKVIALEYPELHCVSVDLDPADAEAKALFDQICLGYPEGKENLAFRQGQKYVPRLVRSRRLEPQPLYLQSDATYLITGGLGGLGLLVAQWLVEQGARHLVLMGRRGPGDEAETALSKLEQIGAQILVVQADVSQSQQVAKVLAEITASMPPLRGVIHAAGVLDDAVLARQDWEQFAKVLSPKVQGAWNLHVLTQNIPLDFFVLFSSAASLLGSPGQGNHAAANTFLDTLAYYRRSQGLPALSINWGAWAELGVVGKRNFSEMTSMQGVGTIAPKQGIQVLEKVFQHPSAQVGVVPINWSQFMQRFTNDTVPAFLAELAREVGSQVKVELASVQQLEFLVQLEKVAPHHRQEMLLAHVQDQVAKVLGRGSSHSLEPHQGFFDIGMDSLTSIELRNRLQTSLGRSLSSTLIFDYPTLDTLAKYLANEMFFVEQSTELPTAIENNHHEQTITSAELKQLSEEDAEALLLKELESIRY